MIRAPSALALAGALFGLFLGGAALGLALAATFASGSWLAAAASAFALPLAFALGLQVWFGLALLSVVPTLLGLRRKRAAAGTRQAGAEPADTRQSPPPRLFGAFVFLPLSSAAGAISGIVTGLASATHPAWLVALVYWLAGTTHGVVAWRLARAGVLVPPESV